MPASQPTVAGARPPVGIASAIDHYFDLALYLLVCAGFGTLVSTGGLDLPSVILVTLALLFRGYLLAQHRRWVISERWTTPLSIAYFVFFATDYLVFSRAFLPATVHLALFGVVVRMFSLRRERDHITLAILAFLMVLASAILTVGSIFLLSFAIFLLMAITTFVLHEMRRSARAASIQAKPSRDPREQRRFALSLARITPALLFLILLLGAALFFLIPRMSAGYMGDYAFGTDLATGFSDRVQLGQIGKIQQSNAVVMHIQIQGDNVGRYDLHWRGVALSKFDGNTWSNPSDRFLLQRQPDDSFRVPQPNLALRSYLTPNGVRENVIRYHVLMEPIGTNVFFLAPWARSIVGDYRLLAGDVVGAVYDADTQHTISQYEAESNIAAPAPAELRAAGRNYPPQISAAYLRLPDLDPRIARLATEITKSASSDFDRASAVEIYLRTHFAYTLQLPRTQVNDPIANFLFERKQGHCEYFASAMAVMLRDLGIPSRVVNGFRSDEFNDLTGNYVVRAKDAHSWVEVYFPGYGWQMFDPTPAGAPASAGSWHRLELYVDAMASFWREWVISYDSSHQYVLGHTAMGRSRAAWEGARDWARSHYHSMLHWAQRSQERVERSPVRWVIFGALTTVVLVLLGNLGRILRFLHEKWVQAHPERSPEQAAALWYERMARTLERRGVEKPASSTPQEFVRNIEDRRLREPVGRFTEVYEGARFGNSPEDAQRLPELYAEVEAAVRSR